MRMIATMGRREPWPPGGEVDVELGDEEVKVGVREVTGVAKDVVVGWVREEVVEEEDEEERVVEEGRVDVEADVVVGGLVVTGGAVEVAVMDGVAEGAGDESPPYVHVPSVPRGIWSNMSGATELK
jgi:hypothetical protein